MKNKDLKKGQKIELHSGVKFLVSNKTKYHVELTNLDTGEVHNQNLSLIIIAKIIK
jgi:P pilus assembly chaperone PapD